MIKALVAEDVKINLILAAKLLEKLGCEVTKVKNGRQALEAAQSRIFDIIFMDCQMPVMDGFAATQAIRAYEAPLQRHTPVVALTAGEDHEKCLKAGMDDYLVKPLQQELVAATLEKWVCPVVLHAGGESDRL
ncbi:MAG: response regulator [Alphaproteobacteria bacterium]|nr:response regulator [Alphaproteobacteria bacterium]